MTKHSCHSATDATRQRGQSTVAFLALGAALAVGLVLAAWIVASSLERIGEGAAMAAVDAEHTRPRCVTRTASG